MSNEIHFAILILSGLLSLVLFLYSLMRVRLKTIYIPLAFFALGITFMSFSDAVYYNYSSIYHYKIAIFEYIFINMISISWFSLMIEFTGYLKKWFKQLVIVAVIFSFSGYLGVITNPFHHLFYRYSTIFFSSNEVYGPWFWYNSVINYILIITGIGLVVYKDMREVSKRNILLVIGVVIPIIANIIYIFDLANLHYDITAAALSISAVVFLYVTILEHEMEKDLIEPAYLMNNIDIGVFSISGSKVVAQNSAFNEILSHKGKFYKVTDIIQYLNEYTVASNEIIENALLSHGKNVSKEIKLKGSGKIIRVDVKSVYKESREIGKIVTLMDLSDLENVEKLNKALQEMNAQLEEQKEKQIRILGHLSHDLMTPVTSIEGYIKYILEGKLGEISEKQRKSLLIVDKNMIRLQKMLENVLLITKLETAKDIYNKKLFDIKVLIIEIYEERNMLAVEKGFDFKLNIELKDTMILGDREKIHTVIDNLLDNAFKYTEPFGQIILFARNEAENIIFGVKNKGKYIDKEYIERITEPFVRLKSVTDKKGVGLGLAIVKSIVNAHNGTFKVESSKSGFNTFSVTIPQY